MISQIIGRIISLFLRIPNNPLKDAIREIFYGEIVSERVVEYPVAFSFLDYKGLKENRKIVDVGCYYSNFPIQLASMGFKVTGIDLQKYRLKHPNFKFVRGDVRNLKFKEEFDIATAISTIEHIGTGFYKESEEEGGDLTATKAIKRILKPKGKFLITVPFGKLSLTDSYKSYDWDEIVKLLNGFEIKEKLFFREQKGKWGQIGLKEALNIDNSKGVRAISFVVAEKHG